jgi:anti-sigma regulatory factor (Ser/Thr protein kinase)
VPTLTTAPERLTLRSSLSELERLAPWIDDVTRHAEPSEEQVFAIQLCLEEALANIIMYGGAPDDASIVIELTKVDGVVTVVIEDSARAFDPTQVPPRTKPLSLGDASVGGVGVHLIRNYSSEMRYERRGNRNRLILRFDRTRRGTAAQ